MIEQFGTEAYSNRKPTNPETEAPDQVNIEEKEDKPFSWLIAIAIVLVGGLIVAFFFLKKGSRPKPTQDNGQLFDSQTQARFIPPKQPQPVQKENPKNP